MYERQFKVIISIRSGFHYKIYPSHNLSYTIKFHPFLLLSIFFSLLSILSYHHIFLPSTLHCLLFSIFSLSSPPFSFFLSPYSLSHSLFPSTLISLFYISSLLPYLGCYPFGLGLIGSMGIMVPILMFGAVLTMVLPVTDRQSLEGLLVDSNAEKKNIEFSNYCEDIDTDMIERERGYMTDSVDLIPEHFSPREVSLNNDFDMIASSARRLSALARAEVFFNSSFVILIIVFFLFLLSFTSSLFLTILQEESRVLDEVIAADALADSEARFERAAVARKAAAAARYLLVFPFLLIGDIL